VPSWGSSHPAAPEVVERDVAAARELCEARRALCAEIGKRIIGQHEVIDHLLIALFSRGHCLFVGVPGWPRPCSSRRWPMCSTCPLAASSSRLT